jgi:2-polyprenyl-3-methyl-5-hydroxy-6-metoxy-1,4-benzoquinol methylase
MSRRVSRKSTCRLDGPYLEDWELIVPDPSLYDSYTDFKSWGGAAAVDRPEDFAALLKAAGLPARPLDILDFGFGDGAFMDWAKAAGHVVTGVEILPDMVGAAIARGHRAILASELDKTLGETRFDVITLLDVMEHLDAEGFKSVMALGRRALKPGGVILAKFPNGDSPVFGRYHYGDLTHERPLTASAVRQWAGPEGMRVVRAFNPRSIPPGFGRGLKRRVTYAARDLIEIAVGFIYFGFRFPMDPNVAVTLMRAEEAPAAVRRV